MLAIFKTRRRQREILAPMIDEKRSSKAALLAAAAVLLLLQAAGSRGQAASDSAAPPAAAPSPDPYRNSFDVRKIGDGVYALIRNYPAGLMVDGNSVFIIGEKGVVVVDAPEASSDMLAALRKLTPLPVQYVINTHWHDDHIMGNHVYRDAFPDVRFIGHESMLAYLPGKGLENRKGMIEGAPQYAAQEREVLAKNHHQDGTELTPEERAAFASDVRLVDRYMAEVPGAPVILPTDTVSARKTLQLGSRTIEIYHLPGHTAADLVVYLPKERIAVTGDLVVFPVPLVGNPQSRVGPWAKSLHALRSLGASTYVPGHGPVLHDDTYAARMEKLMGAIAAAATEAVAHGEDVEGARRRAGLADFRRQFAGKSKLLGFLFDVYVSGPAVDSAFADAKQPAETGRGAP
jgi:glyoxylase-like metal-dependent hydrolase (beta-lactamase superfamily II)